MDIIQDKHMYLAFFNVQLRMLLGSSLIFQPFFTLQSNTILCEEPFISIYYIPIFLVPYPPC